MDTTQSAVSRPPERNDHSPLAIYWVHPTDRLTCLAGDGVQLGRTRGEDGNLPGNLVSRHHASILRRDGSWWLEDHRSKNGTFLDGQRIISSPLHEQNVLRIGEWVGVIARVSPARVRAGTPVSSITETVFGGTAIDEVWGQVERIAPTSLRVMLVGETGTGKEVFAKELHRLSRVSGDWVALNQPFQGVTGGSCPA